MANASKQFPTVRVFGTVGWIVVGLIIGLLKIEASVITYHISAIASLLLGIYSFFLPATTGKSKKQYPVYSWFRSYSLV